MNPAHTMNGSNHGPEPASIGPQVTYVTYNALLSLPQKNKIVLFVWVGGRRGGPPLLKWLATHRAR